MATESMIRNDTEVQMNVLATGLKKHGGGAEIAYVDGRWTASIHFGEETPGSEMAGGAAYGLSDHSPADAMANALLETGWTDER